MKKKWIICSTKGVVRSTIMFANLATIFYTSEESTHHRSPCGLAVLSRIVRPSGCPSCRRAGAPPFASAARTALRTPMRHIVGSMHSPPGASEAPARCPRRCRRRVVRPACNLALRPPSPGAGQPQLPHAPVAFAPKGWPPWSATSRPAALSPLGGSPRRTLCASGVRPAAEVV